MLLEITLQDVGSVQWRSETNETRGETEKYLNFSNKLFVICEHPGSKERTQLVNVNQARN